MVRYFYAWTPLVIVFGTVILLSIPYLALIALMIVALAALAALAWAIASVTHVLSRAISRRWHSRSGMTRRRKRRCTSTGTHSRTPPGAGSTTRHLNSCVLRTRPPSKRETSHEHHHYLQTAASSCIPLLLNRDGKEGVDRRASPVSKRLSELPALDGNQPSVWLNQAVQPYETVRFQAVDARCFRVA
jgi:hypothetical protein